MNSTQFTIVASVPAILMLIVSTIAVHSLIIMSYGYKYDVPLLVAFFLPFDKSINYLSIIYTFTLAICIMDNAFITSFSIIIIYIIKIILEHILNRLLKKIKYDDLFKILIDLEKELNMYLGNDENNETQSKKQESFKQNNSDIESNISEKEKFEKQYNEIQSKQQESKAKELLKQEEEHKKKLLSEYYNILSKTPKQFCFHSSEDELKEDGAILHKNYDDMVKHTSSNHTCIDYNPEEVNKNKDFKRNNAQESEDIVSKLEIEKIKQTLSDDSSSDGKVEETEKTSQLQLNETNCTPDIKGTTRDSTTNKLNRQITSTRKSLVDSNAKQVNDDGTPKYNVSINHSNKIIIDDSEVEKDENVEKFPSCEVDIVSQPPLLKEINKVEVETENDMLIKCERCKKRIEKYEELIKHSNEMLKTTNDEEIIKKINEDIKLYTKIVENEKYTLNTLTLALNNEKDESKVN